jgi:hypothetical protein
MVLAAGGSFNLFPLGVFVLGIIGAMLWGVASGGATLARYFANRY